MDYVVIIPAHNEEVFIGLTLQSIVEQTHLPKLLIVVNDNSTDKTELIVNEYISKFKWISLINNKKKEERASGAKVVRAFKLGMREVEIDYDLVAKIDADLIFPKNYFEKVGAHFNNSPRLGIAGGTIVIEKDGKWVYENFSDKDHVVGAFKCYRKECYEQIEGLRESIGWDSVDELLAKYYKWETLADQSLEVKHLRPLGTETGFIKIRVKIGNGFYRVRYGLLITIISALKTSFRNKPYIISGLATIYGFFQAWIRQDNFIVTPAQGDFIRKYRYNRMKSKLSIFNPKFKSGLKSLF